jgi:hypothetical protein
LLLALPLGAGCWLAWLFLLSYLLAPRPAIGVAAALTLVAGFWLGLRPRRVVQPTLEWPFHTLLLLAGAVGWLSLVGGCQLAPPRDFLLFELPRIAQLAKRGPSPDHPLGPEAMAGVSPFATAAAIGGDPWTVALALGGTIQVLSVLAWLLLLARWNRQAPLAVVLAGLSLFLGTSQGWLINDLPSVAAAHLFAVLALWVWSVRPAWQALPLLTSLALVDAQLALAIAGVTLVKIPRKLPVLGFALLLGWGQGGASLGLLAAGLLWWRHPNKMVRLLATAEFFYPGVFGLAALGMALGRTATVLWKRYPGERLRVSLKPGLALRVPRRLLIGGLTVLAMWLAIAPGEEVFNDRILIYSQKQKAKLNELLLPHSLASWAAWRGPALGLDPADLVAAQILSTLDGPAVYLSGEPEERVEVAALVSALAGGRPLAGWYAGKDGSALLPAAAAVASSGRVEHLAETPARWLVRRGQSPLSVKPMPSASGSAGGNGRRHRTERWGRLHWFEEVPRYEVLRDGKPFGRDFSVVASQHGSVPFLLPDLTGHYLVKWPGSAGQEFSVPNSLPVEAVLHTNADVPSRSLLPVTLTLTNRDEVPLGLSDLRGGRLNLRSLAGKPDSPAPVSPLAGFILEPKQSRDLTLHLRTPSNPDVLELSLDLLDDRGKAHPVPFSGPRVLRSWNRRPLTTVPDGVVKH